MVIPIWDYGKPGSLQRRPISFPVKLPRQERGVSWSKAAPVPEVLSPELRDIQMDYERNFSGMASQPNASAEESGLSPFAFCASLNTSSRCAVVRSR